MHLFWSWLNANAGALQTIARIAAQSQLRLGSQSEPAIKLGLADRTPRAP